MKELGMTQSNVAKALNMAQSTANQKINNIRPFALEEAESFAKLLEIAADEFSAYFFA